jgi:hypothetical protein
VTVPPVARQLLEEGRALFKQGEVNQARLRFNSAISAPLGLVLLEVARTYDPNYLARLPKSDAAADLRQARKLYEQASKLGAQEAKQDLEQLPAGQ